MVKLLEFQRLTDGFNFVFERKLKAGETVYIKTPRVSANKRGINDIGWMSDGNIRIFGTISKNPESTDALWQEITDTDDINKTSSGIKIINGDTPCTVVLRAILN